MNLSEHTPVVKEQMEFHERAAAKCLPTQPRRAAMHTRTSRQLRDLLRDLEEWEQWQQQHPGWEDASARDNLPKKLALSWEEVEGLPDEILKELSISESDRTEFNIISAIRALGGVASLDRIIIYLYRDHGEVQKRMPLNQKLYRMVQKELIYSVPGKKGVYSSDLLSDDEAAKIV